MRSETIYLSVYLQAALSELVKRITLRVCLGGKVKCSLASSGSSSWRKLPRGYLWLATSQLAKRASQTCERRCKRQALWTSGVATVTHPSNVRSHVHEYTPVRTIKLTCQQPSRILSIPLFVAEQNSNWQVLLRRFRSLRATLVSHDKISWFAVRVYLWSTDVSLYSTDHAECLKALQALACQLFPVLDAQDKACHSRCSLASSSKPEDTEVCS